MKLIDEINYFKNTLLIAAAETGAYDNWDNNYAVGNVINAWKYNTNYQSAPPKKLNLTFNKIEEQLTRDEIINIFGNWDGKLKLIPIWLIHQFDDNEILTAISGDTIKKI